MRLFRTRSARRWSSIAVAGLACTLLGLPAALAQTADDVCDDVLLIVSPTSVSGDKAAVAITSQQFEADVPGWASVSWEAAENTTVTGVTVRTASGTATLIDDIETGTVEDALELIFCGTTGPSEPDSDVDGEGDGPQVTQPVDEVCDDVLLTVTPDSISGDETAVSITSQELDADAVGWVSVSWEAAANTTMTGVTVRTASGTATLIDDIETGTVENTLELTFCGTVADDDGDPGDDGIDDDPAEEPATESNDAGGSEGTSGGEGNTTGGGTTGGGTTGGGTTGGGTTGGGTTDDTDGRNAAPAPSDDETTPAPEPEPEREADPEPEPAPEPEPSDGGDNDVAAQDDDTEVLGVQLSQDDDGSGWLLPILLILLVVGAIGAGILVRNRYLASSGSHS